jgi:hypothetical protein
MDSIFNRETETFIHYFYDPDDLDSISNNTFGQYVKIVMESLDRNG